MARKSVSRFGPGAIVLIVAAVLLLVSAALVVDGLTDDVRRSDVAVVLGNKVNPDGRPSPMLQARLDEAVRLYRRRLFPFVIVSGGLGKEGFDEAAVMKAYLVAHGVPVGSIIADNQGVNTRATALNTAALMQAHGWSSVLVVTQYFHISRTRLALKQAGVGAVHAAHARYFALRDLYSIPREVVGYAAYLARPGKPPSTTGAKRS